MADSIRWAISVTPVEELTDESGSTHDIIHSDVGKSLGASGETTIGTELSYNSSKTISGNTFLLLGNDESHSVETLFIRNTGKDSNGDDTSDHIYLSLDGTGVSGVIVAPNEAVLLHLSGVNENEIKAKCLIPADEVVIEFLMDAP